MNQTLVLWPMLALVGWTLAVLGFMGFRRVSSRVHPKEFRLGESPAVPPHVAVVNRNYMNLLEVPVLFYVVALTYYVTQHVTGGVVALAWAFAGLRIAHSAVHLTYNNVLHRLGFFAAANFALIALWALLLVRLA
jgi:hypothetical protein